MNQVQQSRAKARHYVHGVNDHGANDHRANDRSADLPPSRKTSADRRNLGGGGQVGRVSAGRHRAPQLRTAIRSDVRKIHELIQRNQQVGHLLPRELSELTSRIDRFVVGVDGRGSIVACGELVPLSPTLAEIRSLVVSEKRRGRGLGHRVVDELKNRARAAGYDDLCVFAHEPAYFAHMGFSIVPHTWLPEKIMADCRSCPLFRRCEQFAMVTDLDMSPEVRPDGHLHV